MRLRIICRNIARNMESFRKEKRKTIRTGMLFLVLYILYTKENVGNYFIITVMSIFMKIYIIIHR